MDVLRGLELTLNEAARVDRLAPGVVPLRSIPLDAATGKGFAQGLAICACQYSAGTCPRTRTLHVLKIHLLLNHLVTWLTLDSFERATIVTALGESSAVGDRWLDREDSEHGAAEAYDCHRCGT
jgi:hypothetical protein